MKPFPFILFVVIAALAPSIVLQAQDVQAPKKLKSIELKDKGDQLLLQASGESNMVLASYDDSLNLVTKPFCIDQAAKQKEFYWLNDSIYIYWEQDNRFRTYFMANTEAKKSPMQLFLIQKVKGSFPKINWIQKQDVAIFYYTEKPSERSSPNLAVQVYKLHFNTLKVKPKLLEIKAGQGSFLEMHDFFSSDTGYVLLIKEQKLSKTEKRAFRPNAQFFLYWIGSSNQRKMYLTDNSSYVSNIRTRVYKHELYFTYLYSKRNPDVQDSLLLGYVPLDFGQIALTSTHALHDLTSRKGKMNYNPVHEGFRHLYIDYILPSPSGVTVVIENFKSSGDSRTGRSFYYGNLTVLHFNRGFMLSWNLDIPKNQYTLEDEGIYSGYSIILGESNIQFIFYHRPVRKPNTFLFNPKNVHRHSQIEYYEVDRNHGLYKREIFDVPKKYKFFAHTFLLKGPRIIGVFQKKGNLGLFGFPVKRG
jgi:hypothetical protein